MAVTSITVALNLLEFVNAARLRLADADDDFPQAAVDFAERTLDAFDAERGYSRNDTCDAVPPGRRGLGVQRNPNWREALDKLNAMRGRTA